MDKTFLLEVDKTKPEWEYSIRMKTGWWANPAGVDFARLNSYVIARAGGEAFAQKIVDALNAAKEG